MFRLGALACFLGRSLAVFRPLGRPWALFRQGRVSPQFQNSHFCGCFALVPMQSRLIQHALRGHLLDWTYRNRKCEVISSRIRTVVWACGVPHNTTFVLQIYKQECGLYPHGTNLYLGFTSRNAICTRKVQICTSDLQAGM